MIFLLIGIGISIVYAVMMPLSGGLSDTSLWVAKVLAPVGSEENETTRLRVKMSQAAMMEGWLSNVPFFTNFGPYVAAIVGFFYCWWGGLLVLLIALTLGAVTSTLWTKPVTYYLQFISYKMLNRAADYKAKNDITRGEAAESYCKDLERITLLYEGSRRRPPSPKEVKDIPYGDVSYWLEHGSDIR